MSPHALTNPNKPKGGTEGIVLCSLAMLGSRINERHVYLCVVVALWGCIFFICQQKWGKSRVGGLKELLENWYECKGWCRIEERTKESKGSNWSKSEGENKRQQQIIRQKETLLGTVNMGNIHWLIVLLCHTELIPGELVFVCRWEGDDSAVVRTGAHVPLLDTLQQFHIVKPQL